MSHRLHCMVSLMAFNPNEVTIEVVCRLNKFDAPIVMALDVEPRMFDLRPLPRDRDLPIAQIAAPARERAAEMERERERFAAVMTRELAPAISKAIVEAIQKQDTMKGYSRAEWDEMHDAD